jgi:O-antigen ligase
MNKNQPIGFLNKAMDEIIHSAKENILFLPILLYVVSLGLSLEINNFFLIVLMLVGVLKKGSFQFSIHLFFLQLFFLWIALSYFWSIDTIKTLKSISRETHFFILPMLFYFHGIPIKSFTNKILKYFSLTTFFLMLFFILRAIGRFFLTNDKRVFFFHGEYKNDFGLVPKELNAIYLSIFVSVAYFYILQKERKTNFDFFTLLFFLVALFLLSSSIVIFTVVLITAIYYFFYSKSANKMRMRNIVLFSIVIAGVSFYSKIVKLVEKEIKTSTEKNIAHNVITTIPDLHNKITIYDAWNKEEFSPNDFFPGTAFRVYQLRMFFEIISEEDSFWQGLGFNASQAKLKEKGIQYNVFLGNELYEGYQMKNFHNQYLQVFAELGLIGFMLLVVILFINIRNAFLSKDFLHIAFAILMISLFLTESFLWRQRGVAFFVIFFCLFNNKVPQEKLN